MLCLSCVVYKAVKEFSEVTEASTKVEGHRGKGSAEV